jgi:hypothetical protein
MSTQRKTYWMMRLQLRITVKVGKVVCLRWLHRKAKNSLEFHYYNIYWAITFYWTLSVETSTYVYIIFFLRKIYQSLKCFGMTVIIHKLGLTAERSDFMSRQGRNFSSAHVVLTSSGTHLACYPVDRGRIFSRGQTAGARSWPLTSN